MFAGDRAEQVVAGDMYTGTFDAVSSEGRSPASNANMLIPQQSSSPSALQTPDDIYYIPEDIIIPEEFHLRESQTYEGKFISRKSCLAILNRMYMSYNYISRAQHMYIWYITYVLKLATNLIL